MSQRRMRKEVSIVLTINSEDGVSKSIKLSGLITGSDSIHYAGEGKVEYFVLDLDSTANITRSDVSGGVLTMRKQSKDTHINRELEVTLDDATVESELRNAAGVLLKFTDREV